MMILLLFALVLCPSLAFAQEGAATLPEGPGWAAEAWRTWCGIAGFAIPIAVFLTNTIEPMIRDRYPLAAQRIRQLGALSLALFMSRNMKDALRALVVAVTQANRPDTLNVQTAETPTAIVTVAVSSDATAAPKSKPVLVAGAGLVMMAFVLVGCAGLSPELAGSIGRATSAVGKADVAARAIYEREIEECDTDKCVVDTRAEWDPIIEAFGEVRSFWCLVKPADCAPKDGSK